MTALLLLHFLLYLRSDENLDFFFSILWINAEFKKKKNLCVETVAVTFHTLFWSEIICIHLSLCVVQLCPDKNKCLPYKSVCRYVLCRLRRWNVTEQIIEDICISKVFTFF